MKKNLQLTLLSLCLAFGINAQNSKLFNPANQYKKCGTVIPSKEWDDAFNKMVDKYKEEMLSGRRAAVAYTIPVIVHVIHGGEAIGTYPNLSFAQVNSQIGVLNADFAGTGFNIQNLAATAFSTTGAANTEIKFCAATTNTIGQTLPEAGIDRIDYNAFAWANPNTFGSQSSFRSYMEETVKPATIWDPTKYLNVWVCDVSNSLGLLGYATFPAGSGLTGIPFGTTGGSQNDGVWVYAASYGNIGTVYSPYNLGRTAVHEIGHWLGLRHIGGDASPSGDCAATDYCNDTPPQKGNGPFQNGQNYGFPAYPLNATGASSCALAPNGSMFMNFMDYCDDAALYMFTPDQKIRMQAAMAAGNYRASLNGNVATNCNTSASSPTAIITMPATVCNTLGVINTTNTSVGNPIPGYVWFSTPTAGVTFSPSNTSESPTITITGAGVYTITCMAQNTVSSNNSVNTLTVEACDVSIAKNSLLAGHFSLQPNPSNGKVNVNMVLPYSQNIQISVTNVLGQSIINTKYGNITNSTIELDLTNYSNGVYFVAINNGKEKVVKRLILNR